MIAFAKDHTADAETNARIREIAEEMDVDGWSHCDTVRGCWDATTVYLKDGVTLVFSRPVGARLGAGVPPRS